MNTADQHDPLAAWAQQVTAAVRQALGLHNLLSRLAAERPAEGDPAARAQTLLRFLGDLGLPLPSRDAAETRADGLATRLRSHAEVTRVSLLNLLLDAHRELCGLLDAGHHDPAQVVRRCDFQTQTAFARTAGGATATLVGFLDRLDPAHPLHALVPQPYREAGRPAVVLGSASAQFWVVADVLARTERWAEPQIREAEERRRVEEARQRQDEQNWAAQNPGDALAARVATLEKELAEAKGGPNP